MKDYVKFGVVTQYNNFFKNIKKYYNGGFSVGFDDEYYLLSIPNEFSKEALAGLGMNVVEEDYSKLDEIAGNIRNKLVELFLNKPLPMAYSDGFVDIKYINCTSLNVEYVDGITLRRLFNSVQIIGMDSFDKLFRRLLITEMVMDFDVFGKTLTDEVFIQVNKILKSVSLTYLPTLKAEFNKLVDKDKEYTLFGDDYKVSGGLKVKHMAGVNLEAHNEMVQILGKDGVKQDHIRPAIGNHSDLVLSIF